jgi:hypothetical protein
MSEQQKPKDPIREALRNGCAKHLVSYTLRRYPTVYAKRIGAVGKAFDKRQEVRDEM